MFGITLLKFLPHSSRTDATNNVEDFTSISLMTLEQRHDKLYNDNLMRGYYWWVIHEIYVNYKKKVETTHFLYGKIVRHGVRICCNFKVNSENLHIIFEIMFNLFVQIKINNNESTIEITVWNVAWQINNN